MVYSTLVTLRRKGYQGRSPWLVGQALNVPEVRLAQVTVENDSGGGHDLYVWTVSGKLGRIVVSDAHVREDLTRG